MLINNYSKQKLDIDLIISSAAPSVLTPTKSPQTPVNSHFFRNTAAQSPKPITILVIMN